MMARATQSSARSKTALSAHILILICALAGTCARILWVPERVVGVRGKNLTLNCWIKLGPNMSLTQSSWERPTPSGKLSIALYNSMYGMVIDKAYLNRIRFINPTDQDASVIIEDLNFDDIGSHTCKLVTFPLGNIETSTYVDIIAEPKVYITPGPKPLVEGEINSLVAICTAERARPAAEVFWESGLYGRSETVGESNGIVTTINLSYIWTPTSQARSLTCVVRHPALAMELRIPYMLNVQFAPNITVVGQDEVWYVGQKNAKLDCRADANPSPHRFLWTRLDMQMPVGVQRSNGTLTFTHPLQKSDSGTYRCEVQNDIGVRSLDVHIWVREPPPTTTAVHTTNRVAVPGPGTPPSRHHAQMTSPTSASGDTTAVIATSIMTGVLLVVVLLGLGCLCYVKFRTFRGDYYTKQYKGPSDMQKASNLDVLKPQELHNLFRDDSGKGSQDLKPKHDGSIVYPEDEDAWDDTLPAACTYYSDHLSHHSVNPSGPPVLGLVLNNGTPYLQENHYDNDTEGEYVSHKDGSVISRKECFV